MIKKKKIWLSSPHMGGGEKKYLQEAFDTNWIAPSGPHISDFEKKISEISLNYNVAALSSGTAAIHLALILLGIKAGDDVICSSFTFVASVNPIRYLDANPILIDSEPNSWNMCTELLELAIKEGVRINKKPKAIIIVHLYGMPAKIDQIMKIATTYEIPVIEDAAEALGSSYQNRPLGTFGDFAIYSFNGNKIITTSGGGALVCKDENLIERARYLATQSRDKASHYEHSSIGYNYRLSNICAAIGLGQLEVLNERIQQKRKVYEYYKSRLSLINKMSFMEESEGSFSNFWLTTILLDVNSTIEREELRLHLEQDNIESRPLWKPMHLQPIFNNCKRYTNGVSEDFFRRGLCLPSGTNLSEDELERVVSKIIELYEN